ncbi:hypothetical protein [Acinetobacter sp. CE-15]|uniref:hypothetical protein n=1 Tax=Acinetobacter sp. CE-15 TaxID=3425693 RepID=UPI003DA1D521
MNTQIFEMTYQKGTNESTSVFFTMNNLISRNLFIQMMRDDIDIEFNNFKINHLSDIETDLFSLHENIHKESHFHLSLMESKFIESGNANFDNHIFLSIIKRNVLKIT